DAADGFAFGNEQAGQILAEVLTLRGVGEQVGVLGQEVLHDGWELNDRRHTASHGTSDSANHAPHRTTAYPLEQIAKVQLEAGWLGHEWVWERPAVPRAEGSADGGRFDIGWPTATTSAVTPSAVMMAATGNTAKILVRVTMLPSAGPAMKPTLM